MKRLLLAVGLAAVLLGSAAVPTFADGTDYTLETSGASACVNYRATAVVYFGNQGGVIAYSSGC